MSVLAQFPEARMNKTESRYAEELEAQRLAGDINGYEYEAITLRWGTGGKRVSYTPDFVVYVPHTVLEGPFNACGEHLTVELHEVKGFWRDDARVKIKTAAGIFPFRFVAVTYDRKAGWKYERFEG